MVVVAVRDPGTGGHAARLGLRLLLAGGFAVAAWAVGALLGTFTAAAHEAPHGPDNHGAPGETEPTPMAAVTGKLTGLAGTVPGVTTEVTGAVAPPVDTTLDGNVLTPVQAIAPLTSLSPLGPFRHRTGALPRSSLGALGSKALERAAAPPLAAPPPAETPPPQAAGVGQERSRHAHFAPRRHAAPHVGTPVHDVNTRGSRPAPAPLRTGDQVAGVAAAHDTGGNGKHPFAVLGSRPAPVDLRPSVRAIGHDVLNDGRDAALPTTSPD